MLILLRPYSGPRPFLCFFIVFSFCKGYKSCTAYQKLFTSLSCLFSHRHKLGLKRQTKIHAKMQDIYNKETKTTAASLLRPMLPSVGGFAISSDSYFFLSVLSCQDTSENRPLLDSESVLIIQGNVFTS